MLKINLSDDAKNDLQEYAKYFNRIQIGLGQKFEKEINKTFKKIQKMPQAASFAYDTVRYKVVEVFPFIITYEELETNIAILRIFNTHQDDVKILKK
ncbi:MAG TPA: type II toxin-antitoxin system RelE/ParE family toxin [Edaphocola sp.]|nr:type II toxin-antitoxin system RelE/ParE family toxin [Edaphocola sp.]